jgi:hypothetical protein
MSVPEIKAEILKLTPQEQKEVREALDAAISAEEQASDGSQLVGSLKDTVVFHPGWDEDEPAGDWEALRDDDASA